MLRHAESSSVVCQAPAIDWTACHGAVFIHVATHQIR
jgi:hypothetical protein